MTKIVFYVVVSDQIGIYINWAHKNDCQNLSFLRDINEVAKKMVRNGCKMAFMSCKFPFFFLTKFKNWKQSKNCD